MQQPSRQTRRRMHGFSITELMVSVGIIVLLIGISYPFIAELNRSSRVEAGLNIAGMSVDVTRQWVEAEAWANDGSTAAPTLESYSGTAALYCPTGEVRILINDRFAQNTSGDYLEDIGLNGYKDLNKVDYVRMPSQVGVAGVYKDPTDGEVYFIAPPFAVAFNENGQLSYGDADGYIYYVADNTDNFYDTTFRRDINNYDPSLWDGTESSPNYDDTTPKQALAFEAIECVPGLVVFNLEEYLSDFDFANGGRVTLDSTEGQWLRDNGRTIFFSPHTGIALRDETQE